MKWYTCCDQAILENGGEGLIAAVESCLRNTNLKPNIVYYGSSNSLISYFMRIGVNIIYHKLSFFDELNFYRGACDINYDWLIANSLRFDIPIVETEDEYILYTDTDVIFHQDVSNYLVSAPIAAAGEIIIEGNHIRETNRAFNAGVLFINIEFMRGLHDIFRKLLVMLAAGTYVNPWYDQGVLNAVCQEYWLSLPQNFNCRPFYGCQGAIKISHFQYLKTNMLDKKYEVRIPNLKHETLLRRGAAAYPALRRLTNSLVSPCALSALLSACPTAIVSEFEDF